MRRILGRLWRHLGALPLAVLLLLALAFTGLAATLYEARHGTTAVQRDVYRAPWFTLLLALLALNLVAALAQRYPWRARQAGFVLAHAGLLMLLAGAWVSRAFGLDGELALPQGATSDRVTLRATSLQVLVPGQEPVLFPVAFERPPAPGLGREVRFRLPGGELVLVAEDYGPWRQDDAGAAPTLAVKLRLEAGGQRGTSLWLPWLSARTLSLGARTVRVGFLAPEVALPFRVTLLAFETLHYPGSQRPASYSSLVAIADPERGLSRHTLSMNRPLHHRGYVLFQAGLTNTEAVTVTFTVVRAPGLPAVYLGALLVVAGTAHLFWFGSRPTPRAALGPVSTQPSGASA